MRSKIIQLLSVREATKRNGKGYHSICAQCGRAISQLKYFSKTGRNGNARYYHLKCAQKVGLLDWSLSVVWATKFLFRVPLLRDGIQRTMESIISLLVMDIPCASSDRARRCFQGKASHLDTIVGYVRFVLKIGFYSCKTRLGFFSRLWWELESVEFYRRPHKLWILVGVRLHIGLLLAFNFLGVDGFICSCRVTACILESLACIQSGASLWISGADRAMNQNLKVVGRSVHCQGCTELAEIYCSCGRFFCILHMANHTCIVQHSVTYEASFLEAMRWSD